VKLPPVDVVIAGAGAGGGVAAYELSRAGLRVALLERGRVQEFAESGHDELRSQRTTVLGNAFGPDDDRNTRLVKLGDDPDFHSVLPSEGAYCNVAACVGGGTKSFGAMAWRFLEKDFRMRSTYGAPENSTLEDWPISYQDLEPYYERAEWEIGVSGKMGANFFEAPRKKGYPMPALPFNKEAGLLFPAARRLGWHPFPIPMAINSVPYNGRPACIMCPHCVGFGCEVKAKSSTADTVIPKAIATGLCDLRTGCVAKEILTDDRGRARGVAYFQGRQLVEQPCELVIVSCSATESARLLLNSKSKLFPDGLGNHNDWVGRNLQSHAYTSAVGLFDEETYDGRGPAACIALCDFNHGNPGVRGGAVLNNEFIRLPYRFARMLPDTPRWGLAHKQFQRNYYKRSVAVNAAVQPMPVFTNRVEVDPKVTDAWGIPVARITFKTHPADFETGRFVADRSAAWLKEAGAKSIYRQGTTKGSVGGQHQAGTCRMGADPKTSVTTPYGKLHTVDNVFVVDGSLHVTNGGFNPSLTILALAFRSSEYIAKEWKGTHFR
jgi:choline dehydrogenase-like flavoprotein